MNVTPLKLTDAFVLNRWSTVITGFLWRVTTIRYLSDGFTYNFIQDNQSLSAEAGVLRGLHYQLNPKAQTKLIRVLTGVIYDVIVDIRKALLPLVSGLVSF